jgi:hypothetical protein
MLHLADIFSGFFSRKRLKLAPFYRVPRILPSINEEPDRVVINLSTLNTLGIAHFIAAFQEHMFLLFSNNLSPPHIPYWSIEDNKYLQLIIYSISPVDK